MPNKVFWIANMVFGSKVNVNMPIGDIGRTVNCGCELS